MKTLFQQIAIATLAIMALGTANAAPMLLPEAGSTVTQTGTFTVTADTQQITLTGTPISLTTAAPIKVDAATGTSLFKTGSIKYNDGNYSIDGNMAKTSLGRHVENGQVTYMLKGLIYGVLTQGSDNINVKGDFSVTTLPMPEGPAAQLDNASLDSGSIILTQRSKATK